MSFTFTYSGDPANNARDAVRFYVGDVDEDRPLLCDDEVDFTLVEHTNQRLAAAVCADALQAKFTREATQKVGDISKNLSDVAKAFAALATKLRREAGKRALPSFPAISQAFKDSRAQDTDLVQPDFPVGLGDNPWAVQLAGKLNSANWSGW
jgi:hypothetical protein